MSPKNNYKYSFLRFLIAALALELICWLILWEILSIFGYFSTDAVGIKVAFLFPKGAWGFPAIPLILLLYLRHIKRRKKLVDSFAHSQLHSILTVVSTRKLFIRFAFLRMGIFFTVLALMQPALGHQKVTATATGGELVFALDVSNSMNTRDTKAKEARLTVAKRVMNQFINKADIGQFGLVIFAGDAYAQLPLTLNKNAAKLYINDVSTDDISNQGTNIGSAFSVASQLFSEKPTKKVLVLITDGEDHEGNIDEGMAELKKKNVRLLVFGVGSEKGGLVPDNNSSSSHWMRDKNGKVVVSKINATMLKKIASKANGGLLVSDAPFPNISKFLTLINNSWEHNDVPLEFKVKKNRYQWPLGFALLSFIGLLLIGTMPQKQRNE